MIEFNLEKHKPKIVYDVQGTKKYLCRVRKMLIHITPEETVRQSFLNYLIKEVKIPRTQLLVEEPVSHHQSETEIRNKGRMDVLVLDHENIPFIVYECKKETESFTDNVYSQAMDYFEAINTIDYVGVVIGNQIDLISFDYENDNVIAVKYAEHPKYTNLCLDNEEVLIEDLIFEDFVRPNYKDPINEEELNDLFDYGVIGNGTNKKLFPFLINLYGWIQDEKDKLQLDENFKDIGIKFTKFGNAGGGNFTQQYRAFLLENIEEKPIIFLGLNSMSSGENSPIGTSLFVAIETNEHSHSSLQLRCDKYINIENHTAKIWHDATITIGKLGAAKRQDLIDFIASKENNILIDNQIILGEINFKNDINSQQEQTQKFIQNLIEYAILRDEFRKHKKASAIS
ncbi:type I restriction enzyme HsdR N-terminal domain-containing protein [Flavobacterium cucumis]|uniref:Type I restriction enzyme R protein N terminus (HSDR_N) n=1 Tax=Flavobacterium cucumis TaxID=416016 RepID=A0A1M7ZS46_9FLAO|nr:type I restriction enzyme HsdR N-terminal domain-containing protein [Flavobacterium cucumis]SHO71704.1 Type I restriction enzyme R protein N terminus (HSDR_N) [Flavobacterium cucumis]